MTTKSGTSGADARTTVMCDPVSPERGHHDRQMNNSALSSMRVWLLQGFPPVYSCGRTSDVEVASGRQRDPPPLAAVSESWSDTRATFEVVGVPAAGLEASRRTRCARRVVEGVVGSVA